MATYGSTAGVQALVPQVTLGASSAPTTTQVTAWLTEGYAIINRYLGNGGYVAPVVQVSAPIIYDELSALNNLYAAAYVLRSQKIDSASGEGEDRAEVWLEDFWARLKELVASNLTVLGVTLIPVTPSSRPRRIRTIQGRRIDGYARGATGESWAVQQGEYTGETTPSE